MGTSAVHLVPVQVPSSHARSSSSRPAPPVGGTSERTAAPFPCRDVTSPGDWDRWAGSLDPLDLSAERAVVVAPHPDDETFGCGGLIALLTAQGAEVVVVTVSDGGASHPLHPDLVGVRQREQAAAVRALGCPAPPTWLGLPDGGLHRHRGELRDLLRRSAAGSDLVIAPWPGDGHPDHEAAGTAAVAAAGDLGVRVVSYPVWLWRWGRPADVASRRVGRLDLPAGAVQAKRSAMACFPSQTTDRAGEVIVDAAMLERFGRPYEVIFDG